ncbi:Pili assembly chaperone, N-terminal protein (plasmid) [Rahnella aceris]|uniref:Pili assembly chaperone, N-terminal protein n=1 Tax=Rahnella sp. (strain Y9602) TaxID=2703885 RepID=A0A0H3FHE8_RAHSY|nr:fimbria/pilus periplasmic chaperone [Rahnella aceris]ADW76657.1 Pili assembly chaperone, N-terminal protein [Rahnella aceris]
MSGFPLRSTFIAVLMSAACLAPSLASAGGIMLGGTRVIYPAGQKQVTMSVRNTSEQSSFLVQSWVAQSDEKKSQDFVVTPPLYVSGPGNENTLRLMYVGVPPSADRETLYYFNSKAIPSIDKKEMEGKNMLMLAAVTRIKLFYRPAGLTPTVEKAPAELTFHRAGSQMRIENPTPYYLTLAEIKVGDHKLQDTMVSPRSDTTLALPAVNSGQVTYRTINDFGAVTPEMRAELK